jgi:DprA/Smf-like nucleotide binding protein involved in DNA uptake
LWRCSACANVSTARTRCCARLPSGGERRLLSTGWKGPLAEWAGLIVGVLALARTTGLDVAAVTAALVELELAGAAVEGEGRYRAAG